MQFDRLRAKSRPKELARETRDPESVYLAGHLSDVLDAATCVLDCTGDVQLSALGLRPDRWGTRLRSLVRLAGALHDIGKANDHFQEMIRDQRILQGLRHEWVTVVILQQEGWQTWLSQALEVAAEDWPILLWSIAGHHPAYGRPSPPKEAPAAGSTMTVLQSHPDFQLILNWLADTFRLGSAPKCSNIPIGLTGLRSVFASFGRLLLSGNAAWQALDPDTRRFVAATKACLIAADIAGSALPRAPIAAEKRGAWIQAAFARVPSEADLKGIVGYRLRGAQLRVFQRCVAASKTRITLVRAGCGTGKTVGAYEWAARNCPGRRLYFCYPTTGTATEGYRDYLFDPAEAEGRFGARLFHGRADVDLEIILGAGKDDEGPEEVPAARLESLDAWSTPIVSCTVDTVLGLVQNNRRGLYAWPALAGAAFVFDEIHAYDERLFAALLRFLEAMQGCPIMLMTASLPKVRLEALRGRVAALGERLTEIAGPEDLERLPRYKRADATQAPDLVARVRQELEARGKVLWVCNTVGRAMQAAEQSTLLRPFIYHSHFRYEDKVLRHADVVKAFDPNTSPDGALAICTQVAEMSLDLSASLLITDLCPVPGLIQRLGRLNRRAVPPTLGQSAPPTRSFIVVEPTYEDGSPCTLPYDERHFESARMWLATLGPGDLSQADLVQKWVAEDSSPVSEIHSAWLDDGPTTTVPELRSASPGITIVLQRDLQALRNREKRVSQVALPMPPPPARFQWRTWPDFKGVPIAPEGTIKYDAKKGAIWQE